MGGRGGTSSRRSSRRQVPRGLAAYETYNSPEGISREKGKARGVRAKIKIKSLTTANKKLEEELEVKLSTFNQNTYLQATTPARDGELAELKQQLERKEERVFEVKELTSEL